MEKENSERERLIKKMKRILRGMEKGVERFETTKPVLRFDVDVQVFFKAPRNEAHEGGLLWEDACNVVECTTIECDESIIVQ